MKTLTIMATIVGLTLVSFQQQQQQVQTEKQAPVKILPVK